MLAYSVSYLTIIYGLLYYTYLAHALSEIKDVLVTPRAPWQATKAGVRKIHHILLNIKWPQGGRILCTVHVCTICPVPYICAVHVIDMNRTVPCPHCSSGLVAFTSYDWIQLTGTMGVHLLSSPVSGIKHHQYEAMTGVLRICGMMRLKVVAPSEQPVKQTFVVETLVMCETWLPLHSATQVRDLVLHFYQVGGWADDLAVTPGISK